MRANRKTVALLGFYFAYFLSYFIKLSPSIIMPVLQLRYSLTSAETGFIASMFFLPYATMQLFVGPLSRKIGAAPLVGLGMLVAATGLMLFSHGTTVAVLAAGRFLLGIGCGPIFIGMIYFMRESFEPERFARYYGYGVLVSALGSIFAAAPLKFLLESIPEEGFFTGISVFTFAFGIFMILIDRQPDRKHQASHGNIITSIARDIRITFSSRLLTAGVLIWIIQATSLVCYQGLWCTKWTETTFPTLNRFSGLSGIAISIGAIIASTCGENWVGAYMRRTGRNLKRTLISICFMHIAATMLLSAVKQTDSTLMFCISLLCDVMYGFSTATIVVQGGIYVKENTGAAENASVMGVYNFIGCIGQQLSQWLTGVEIDVLAGVTSLGMAFCLTFSTLAAIYLLITLTSAFLMRRNHKDLP